MLVALSVAVSAQMRGCGAGWPVADGTRKDGPSHPVPAAKDDGAAQRAYDAEVRAAWNRYQKRIAERTEAFAADLRKNGPSRFDTARAAIPGIRKEFGKMSVMTGVVKDGALDKVRGGDRLERRLAGAVEKPFIVPCVRAGESLAADGEAFIRGLEKEYAAFCAELDAAGRKWPEAVPAEFSADALRTGLDRAGKVLSAMPFKATLTAGETILEAVTFRATLAALRRLVLKVSGKAIGKATATVVAPACDGPFPVGDILAVGFAAWTVADIYELTQVLPREIGKALERSVEETQKDTIRSVEKAARKAADAYRKAGQDLAKAASATRRRA